MVFVNCFRVPSVGQVIEDHLDDLDVRVVNPGSSLLVQADVRRRSSLSCHGRTLTDPGAEARPPHSALRLAAREGIEHCENMLFRRSLALAGASAFRPSTLGAAPSAGEDGLLAGLQAALLNLHGTELVV